MLPVVFIVSISLVTTLGLVLTSAYALNTSAESALRHLASSMLGIEAQKLRNVTQEYGARLGGQAEAAAAGDIAGSQRNLGAYLSRTYGISMAVIAGADRLPLAIFENGRQIEGAATRHLPRGILGLMESAGTSQLGSSEALSDLVRIGDDVHLAAVRPIDLRAGEPVQGSPSTSGFLVLTQALRGGALSSLGEDFGLLDLDVVTLRPAQDTESLTLRDGDGIPIGYLSWRSTKPGDRILWHLMPTLSLALLAMAYLLYQFSRSTDLVFERQSNLMTSLRRERELRDLKTRFVSMVSHELRTPLSTILSAADLLERYDGRMSPEERQREFGAIRQAVLRLTRMMENVMLIGRSDVANVEQDASPVDMGTFCQELWDETARAMNAQHRLTLRGSAADKIVVTDDAHLRAVLSNLIQNAIKYSPGQSEVIIDLEAQGDGYSISVTDFGPGIPAEEIEEIFEAFQRGKSVAKTINGTGLGLAVARSSAERLGGTLTVQSEPGTGTTFELNLPGRIARRPQQAKRKSHDQNSRN